jgi:hypothetical protein
MNNMVKNIITKILLILVIYTGISMLAYSFRHPEKTQTQVFKCVFKALTWKD